MRRIARPGRRARRVDDTIVLRQSALRRLARTSLGTFVFLALGLITAGGSQAIDVTNEKAIWEQAASMVCTGLFRLECAGGACEEKTSKAEFKVDFQEETVEYIGLPFGEKIIAKHFIFYNTTVGSDHVIFFGGRMMDFDVDNAVAFDDEKINAVTLRYDWRRRVGSEWAELDRSTETRFRCTVNL